MDQVDAIYYSSFGLYFEENKLRLHFHTSKYIGKAVELVDTNEQLLIRPILEIHNLFFRVTLGG